MPTLYSWANVNDETMDKALVRVANVYIQQANHRDAAREAHQMNKCVTVCLSDGGRGH